LRADDHWEKKGSQQRMSHWAILTTVAQAGKNGATVCSQDESGRRPVGRSIAAESKSRFSIQRLQGVGEPYGGEQANLAPGPV
jgi:hypothetical protein